MIPTPDHSSFPSGHAAEAFALATVMHRLMTGDAATEGLQVWAMPFRLAHRIAVNRTVAGLHFPVDSAAGAIVGCAIGDAVCDVLDGAALKVRSFDGSKPFDDFTAAWLQQKSAPDPAGGAVAAPALARAHWLKARLEWGSPSP